MVAEKEQTIAMPTILETERLEPARQVESLSIDLIEAPKALQPRIRINPEHVERLREVVKSKKAFEGKPAVVFKVIEPPKKEGEESITKYFLADGFHRREAFIREGKKRMEVEVRDGTITDALKYAVGSNQSHGLPITTQDKERAITLCLEDEKLGTYSNRQLSKICNVSDSLVSRVRDEWEKENRDRAKAKRVGADGKPRKGKLEAKEKAPVVEEAEVPEAGHTKTNGMKDFVLQEVPEILAHVFASRQPIVTASTMLAGAKASIEAMRKSGALAYLPDYVESNIQKAIESLANAMPLVVCAHCGGRGCKECVIKGIQTGFLSAGEWARLKPEERRAFEEKAHAEKPVVYSGRVVTEDRR